LPEMMKLLMIKCKAGEKRLRIARLFLIFSSVINSKKGGKPALLRHLLLEGGVGCHLNE
jgi:hypothetical protein